MHVTVRSFGDRPGEPDLPPAGGVGPGDERRGAGVVLPPQPDAVAAERRERELRPAVQRLRPDGEPDQLRQQRLAQRGQCRGGGELGPDLYLRRAGPADGVQAGHVRQRQHRQPEVPADVDAGRPGELAGVQPDQQRHHPAADLTLFPRACVSTILFKVNMCFTLLYIYCKLLNKRTVMGTQMVGVRLDSELVERIDKVAETQGASRTAVIDRALRIGISEEEELLATLEGKSVTNRVQRVLLNGLIKSNLLEVMASVVNEEIDPGRKSMILEKLDEAKSAKRKVSVRPAAG